MFYLGEGKVAECLRLEADYSRLLCFRLMKVMQLWNVKKPELVCFEH